VEVEILLSTIGWIMAGAGSLILCVGILVSYIFKSHVKSNENMFEQNRDDHKTIFDKIEGKK